MAILKLLNLL